MAIPRRKDQRLTLTRNKTKTTKTKTNHSKILKSLLPLLRSFLLGSFLKSLLSLSTNHQTVSQNLTKRIHLGILVALVSLAILPVSLCLSKVWVLASEPSSYLSKRLLKCAYSVTPN